MKSKSGIHPITGVGNPQENVVFAGVLGMRMVKKR
jgi:hypothetical protein